MAGSSLAITRTSACSYLIIASVIATQSRSETFCQPTGIDDLAFTVATRPEAPEADTPRIAMGVARRGSTI
jgi:hypothetical protein